MKDQYFYSRLAYELRALLKKDHLVVNRSEARRLDDLMRDKDLLLALCESHIDRWFLTAGELKEASHV